MTFTKSRLALDLLLVEWDPRLHKNLVVAHPNFLLPIGARKKEHKVARPCLFW